MAALPAGRFPAGLSSPALKNPLERVIDNPPVRVEVGRERIGSVRRALSESRTGKLATNRLGRLAHPLMWFRFGRDIMIAVGALYDGPILLLGVCRQ